MNPSQPPPLYLICSELTEGTYEEPLSSWRRWSESHDSRTILSAFSELKSMFL